MDIFRPQNAKDTMLPVIINVHGGGLLLGNKEFNRYFCALLCKKGFLVYSIEYRLVPDCMIFDQLRDVFAAMDFIKKRVKPDGGDLSHVYMSETVEVHALLHMLMQFRTATKLLRQQG